MVEKRKRVRRVVLATTLVLAIGVAGSALAEPVAWSGGWSTIGLERLTSWWTTLWAGEMESKRAAASASPNLDPDGAYPNLDPDGPSAQPVDPGDAVALEDGETDDDPSAYPNLDPNG